MADGTTKGLAKLSSELERLIREGARNAVTDDELAAFEARSQRDARRERLGRSELVLRPEARRLILADQLLPTSALHTTRAWLAAATRPSQPGPHWLLLCGGMGNGKTTAAAWALSRQEGRFATVETFLRDYRRYLDDRGPVDRTQELRDRYGNGGLLVLDELGTESDSVLMRSALHWLAEHRHTRRRHLTIVLTNLSKDDVFQRFRVGVYDMRTADRLRGCAMFASVDQASLRRSLPGNEGLLPEDNR